MLSTITGDAPVDPAVPPADALVAIYLEVTDVEGQARTSFETGEEFLLNVLVEDLSPAAEGIFTAMLDVYFDNHLIVPTKSPAYGADFPNLHLASCGEDGVLDEIGAMAGLTPNGPGTHLLMQIPMVAIAPGSATLSADPADNAIEHAVLVYGGLDAVSTDRITYGAAQIDISGSPLTDIPAACNSDVPKGPVHSDSELEDIDSQYHGDTQDTPTQGSTTQDTLTQDTAAQHDGIQVYAPDSVSVLVEGPAPSVATRPMVISDPSLVAILLSEGSGGAGAGWRGVAQSLFSVGGKVLVKHPWIIEDAPVATPAAAAESGVQETVVSVPGVPLHVELPTGFASVTSESTVNADAQNSDSELPDLLPDSLISTLVADGLDAGK